VVVTLSAGLPTLLSLQEFHQHSECLAASEGAFGGSLGFLTFAVPFKARLSDAAVISHT
jgi:hypothetical protein